MRSKLFPLALVSVFAFGLAACGDDDGGTNNNNNARPCNHDTVCDADETCVSCSDCCVTCDLNTTGTNHDYIVEELFLPTSAQEAKTTGVDLNGDGTIDNKLGAIIALFGSQGGDINGSINENITAGELILLGRVKVDAFPDDDVVVAQIFQGSIPTGGSTPIFDGNDEVAIGADSPTDLFLCGQMDAGMLAAGPANLTITFPLPGADPISITLARAQMVSADTDNFTGEITADHMTELMIGGGLTKNEIDTKIIPAVLEYLNGAIAEDPNSTVSTTVLDMFDGCPGISDTIPGCEGLVEGVGPDCLPDEVLTVKEMKCNTLFDSATQPDVDTDGDGVDDLLSLGLRIVNAVPCTIVPLH